MGQRSSRKGQQVPYVSIYIHTCIYNTYIYYIYINICKYRIRETLPDHWIAPPEPQCFYSLPDLRPRPRRYRRSDRRAFLFWRPRPPVSSRISAVSDGIRSTKMFYVITACGCPNVQYRAGCPSAPILSENRTDRSIEERKDAKKKKKKIIE